MSLCRADHEREAAAYRASLKAVKPAGLTPPITYTNATMKGLYRGSAMASPRADADNHLSIISRGLSAQVTRT